MKKWIFTVLFLKIFIGFSQGYKIEYSHNIEFSNNKTEAIYQLTLNEKKAVYHKLSSEFTDLDGNEVLEMNADVIPFVIKDYSEAQITYNQPIFRKIKFIQEGLPLQKWELLEETKKFGSYLCKKAKTSFRGRDYIAWYTTDISVIGGPWKFDGLPGLILQVSSLDGVINIEALNFKSVSKVQFPEFNFENEDLISWGDYTEQYKKVIKRLKMSLKAESTEDMSLGMNLNLVETLE